LSRLTGISTPIGGLSWEPATPDVGVARSVLIFLEDRRVLYNPTLIEYGPYCVRSVLEIRQFLTDVLSKQEIGDALAEHLRVIRAACRGFLDQYSAQEGDPSSLDPDLPEDAFDIHRFELNQALGELRAVFGNQIAQIAVKYDLDVEEPLAYVIHTALPTEQDYDQDIFDGYESRWWYEERRKGHEKD
jgi:hypothetical protein